MSTTGACHTVAKTRAAVPVPAAVTRRTNLGGTAGLRPRRGPRPPTMKPSPGPRRRQAYQYDTYPTGGAGALKLEVGLGSAGGPWRQVADAALTRTSDQGPGT